MKWISLLLLCFVAGCTQQFVQQEALSPATGPGPLPADPLPPLSTETEILAEGVAALGVQGNAVIARDNAIDDALRKAVEQGVGTFIDSETQVSNFQLISDEIYSHTHGYVSSYSIIHEEQTEDLYRIVIRAVVNTEGIEDDLAAIGILLAEQGRPRVMVVVTEMTDIYDLSRIDGLMSSVMFETMLMDYFRRQGFPVVDATAMAEIMDRDQIELILGGDDETASLLGLRAGAEIVVAGVGMHETETRMIAGTPREMHDYHVSCRVINTRTGSVFAATALSISVPFSESQARTQAADSTASALVSEILSGWVTNENVTVIVATNADFDMVQRLRSELNLRIRGVSDVITRDFIGSRATLEVISEISTAEVIDELTSGDYDLEFEVTGFSGNRVDIQFSDH